MLLYRPSSPVQGHVTIRDVTLTSSRIDPVNATGSPRPDPVNITTVHGNQARLNQFICWENPSLYWRFITRLTNECIFDLCWSSLKTKSRSNVRFKNWLKMANMLLFSSTVIKINKRDNITSFYNDYSILLKLSCLRLQYTLKK